MFHLNVQCIIILFHFYCKVSAIDIDKDPMNGKVTYKLEGYDSQRFIIRNTTGVLQIIQPLNISFQRWYNFTAIAEDCAPLDLRR